MECRIAKEPKTGVLLATTTTRVHRLDAQSYLQLPGQPVPTAQASRGTLQLDNAPAASTQTLMSFKVRDVNFLFTSAGVDTPSRITSMSRGSSRGR